MEKRQKSTAEFKRETVGLLSSRGQPAALVARELWIPRNRLYNWAKDFEDKGSEACGGSGRPKASSEELSVRKREHERLAEELEILEKGRRRTSLDSFREVRLDPQPTS